VRPGLAEGRAGGRALAGPQVEADRRLRLARLGAVLSQHLRLALWELGPHPLDRLGRPPVQRAAALAQQRALGGIADQCVAEGIDGLRRLAAPLDQVGRGERVERRPQRRPGQAGHLRQQVVGELAPEYRAGLRHPADGGEPVQAGHQRGLQAARHGERGQPSVAQRPTVGLLAQQPGLQHRPAHLLDEQRHPVRPRQHLRLHFRRQRLAAGHPPQQLQVLRAGEAVELHRRDVRLPDPGAGVELGPVGHDQQQGQRRRIPHEQVEQLARGRVDPVRVLDHHQHGPARR
jgi:hypothetical protein